MLDEPVQVIVAAFQEPRGGSRALRALRATQTRALVGVVDAAVIFSGGAGVEVREAVMRSRHGFALCPLTVAVIGLVAGPLGSPRLGGGMVDELATRLSDGGFPGHRLRALGMGLAGGSALVVVVEPDWVDEVSRDLRRAARVVSAELPAWLARELREEGALLYTVGGDGKPLYVERAGGRITGVREVPALAIAAAPSALPLPVRA